MHLSSLRTCTKRLCGGWLSAAVAAVGLAQAAVEVGKDAKIVARAYGELPPESRITVEIPNESDMNIWVRDNVVTDLTQRGYQIVDDASLVLKLNAEARSANEDGSRFSLEGDQGHLPFQHLSAWRAAPLRRAQVSGEPDPHSHFRELGRARPLADLAGYCFHPGASPPRH